MDTAPRRQWAQFEGIVKGLGRGWGVGVGVVVGSGEVMVMVTGDDGTHLAGQ